MNEHLNTPPYDERAEQSVLGALLANNDYFDDVSEILTIEDFYNRGHRVIFTAIEKSIKQGKPADVVTISDHPDIDLRYCADIVKNCPASANAIVYAQTIRKLSTQRALIGAANEIAEQAFSRVDSATELLGDAERKLAQVTERLNVTTEDNSAKAGLKESYDRMRELAESDGSLQGITTGIQGLDDLINGLKKSTFVVLAARPGIGKTTFALNIAEGEAMRGGYPLVFSIEMMRYQIMNKMISSNGNVPLSAIMRPKSMDDYQWAGVGEAMKRLKATNLEVIENGSITTDMIRIECRRYVRKHGQLTLIVVDYVQIVRGKKADNRTNEVDAISRDLKALAKEFNCPVLGLSQLSRDIEKRRDKTPLNSDLRESGQLEQDAEEIIFIHNEENPDKQNPNDGLAKLIVSKCRNGKIGNVVVNFNGAYSHFSDTTRQWASHSSQPFAKSNKFEG